MKTHFSFVILMCSIFLIGCGSTPVDISGVTRQADLERYIGRTVVFTGKYMPTKALSISNGEVSIEVHRTGSFSMEKDTTVTGVLKKYVIAPMPQQNPPVQMIPPGVHYFIQ